MPKKKSDTSAAAKPGKTAAPRGAAKKPVPGQADLFEDQPAIQSPKKARGVAVGRVTKPRATAPSPPPPPTKKTASSLITAKPKEYIQKIPYWSVLTVGYVALVLAWDALVTIGDTRTVNWAVFQWRPADLQVLLESFQIPHFLVGWMAGSVLTHVDLFKVLFWLVLPVAICLWRMDWDYFTKRRVKPADWFFLGGMCALAVLAIISVKFVPVLANQYRGLGHAALSFRLQFFVVQLLWVVSWLPGWEFMHRYFLLRRVSVDFPRFGWLLVPLAEGTYHLLKPWPETLAMVAFSVIMTQYALRRKNILIPFLAHFAVEVLLIIGMMVW